MSRRFSHFQDEDINEDTYENTSDSQEDEMMDEGSENEEEVEPEKDPNTDTENSSEPDDQASDATIEYDETPIEHQLNDDPAAELGMILGNVFSRMLKNDVGQSFPKVLLYSLSLNLDEEVDHTLMLYRLDLLSLSICSSATSSFQNDFERAITEWKKENHINVYGYKNMAVDFLLECAQLHMEGRVDFNTQTNVLHSLFSMLIELHNRASKDAIPVEVEYSVIARSNLNHALSEDQWIEDQMHPPFVYNVHWFLQKGFGENFTNEHLAPEKWDFQLNQIVEPYRNLLPNLIDLGDETENDWLYFGNPNQVRIFWMSNNLLEWKPALPCLIRSLRTFHQLSLLGFQLWATSNGQIDKVCLRVARFSFDNCNQYWNDVLSSPLFIDEYQKKDPTRWVKMLQYFLLLSILIFGDKAKSLFSGDTSSLKELKRREFPKTPFFQTGQLGANQEEGIEEKLTRHVTMYEEVRQDIAKAVNYLL